MVQGESPYIVFDVITAIFEEWYNPNIIYGASCSATEMGLNRSQTMLVASDPLHTANHTTCNESCQSKHCEELTKGAGEHFNSLLRSIQALLMYMAVTDYMSAMTVFVAFHKFKYIYVIICLYTFS